MNRRKSRLVRASRPGFLLIYSPNLSLLYGKHFNGKYWIILVISNSPHQFVNSSSIDPELLQTWCEPWGRENRVHNLMTCQPLPLS